jgi:hypothetical protein
MFQTSLIRRLDGTIGTLIQHWRIVFRRIGTKGLEFGSGTMNRAKRIQYNGNKGIAVRIFGSLPLKLSRQVCLTEKTVRMVSEIKRVTVVPVRIWF